MTLLPIGTSSLVIVGKETTSLHMSVVLHRWRHANLVVLLRADTMEYKSCNDPKRHKSNKRP